MSIDVHTTTEESAEGLTYTSLATGAKNALSPSSVVEYARLPAKTCEGDSERRVPRQRWK